MPSSDQTPVRRGRHRGAGTSPDPQVDGLAVLLEPERRRWREHLAPAALVVVGVLIVVAAGLALRARDADAPAAAPEPRRTVLGAAPTPATDQLPIPLESITASPAPPPPVDSIVFERSSVPKTVDLAAEGTADWVHWGEQGTYSLERHARGGFAILEGTPDESRERHELSPETFRWTGGTPLGTASGVRSGVRTCGDGSGFSISAPAGTAELTVRLYVGVTAARGRLEARLSTGGRIVSSELEQRDDELATAAYTISYHATGGGRITLRWTTEEVFDGSCAGVAVQAATLR